MVFVVTISGELPRRRSQLMGFSDLIIPQPCLKDCLRSSAKSTGMRGVSQLMWSRLMNLEG